MGNAVIKYQEYQRGGAREFLSLFFKHKSIILLTFFTVVITVAVLSFITAPVYEAKSTLLIKYGREYMYHPEVGSVQPMLTFNQEEILNSEIQILTSRDLIRKVVESINVANLYPDLVKNASGDIKPVDMAIDRFSKNLKVEAVKKSNVLEVTFRNGNPQLAAKAVNTLIDSYKGKHLQVFSNPQSSFLEGQVATLKKKLTETEDKMQSFKQKNRVYSLDEQRTLLLGQRTGLDTELKGTRNRISELRKKVASLRSQTRALVQNRSLYTPTERDKIIVDARSRLLALQLNEQELLRKYTESNRLVVDVRKEIQMVRNFLKEQESEISAKVSTGNTVYQEAQKELVTSEAELSAQTAKLASLGGQLGELDHEIRALDLSEKDMQNLKREQTVDEKNYRTYGDKMEEARISDEMNKLKLANISVIEAAAVPIKPVKPKKILNIALGIIFGALSGIGLAYLSEQNSQTFTDPESAERRLKLAVIACIPYKE